MCQVAYIVDSKAKNFTKSMLLIFSSAHTANLISIGHQAKLLIVLATTAASKVQVLSEKSKVDERFLTKRLAERHMLLKMHHNLLTHTAGSNRFLTPFQFNSVLKSVYKGLSACLKNYLVSIYNTNVLC